MGIVLRNFPYGALGNFRETSQIQMEFGTISGSSPALTSKDAVPLQGRQSSTWIYMVYLGFRVYGFGFRVRALVGHNTHGSVHFINYSTSLV